jgi:hypothetical protein
MSCICQNCGDKYKVDIILDNQLWKLISSKKKLLCGKCIIDELESKGYGAFKLEKNRSI